MKKIIVKTALFIVPFALLYIVTLFFYSVNKGDLIRIGFMKDDKNYDQKLVFSNELKEKIHFTNISNINLNQKSKYTVFTIGDSFSEQTKIGYQNYLAANNIKVLHMDRFLHENPLETVHSFLNGNLLNTIKVDYIVLESVQRDFIKRVIKLDTTKAITAIALQKLIIKHNSKKTTTEEGSEAPFYSSTIFKLPMYHLYYQFDDNAFFSKTYQVTTKKNLFSANNKKLLFLADDVKSTEKYDTKVAVEMLNNILNQLSKKCKAKGIKLIVLPCPDKLDAYYDQIVNNSDYQKPMFFSNLDKVKKNYLYVDAKKIITKAINTKKDIYFYDDSHWSPNASKLIAEEINSIIKNRQHAF